MIPIVKRWLATVCWSPARRRPRRLPEQVWLRFVEDRPISAVTTQYLAWCCEKLEKLGKTALLHDLGQCLLAH